jgi:hypothetical protein
MLSVHSCTARLLELPVVAATMTASVFHPKKTAPPSLESGLQGVREKQSTPVEHGKNRAFGLAFSTEIRPGVHHLAAFSYHIGSSMI